MPSVDELLNAAEVAEETLTETNDKIEIDADTRTMIIPDTERIFGVMSDEKGERKYFRSEGGTIIAVLSGHTHKQDNIIVDGINHIVFKNGFSFFELVSIDLIAKTITCNPINNTELQKRIFSFD